jgi:hypothetical protein
MRKKKQLYWKQIRKVEIAVKILKVCSFTAACDLETNERRKQNPLCRDNAFYIQCVSVIL